MKEVEFKEVIEFLEGPGVRKWQFRDKGIKLVNIRNLVDDKLKLSNTDNFLEENEVKEKYNHFLLQEGDFIMASSGVTWGKIAEVEKQHLPLCLNTSIIKLKPKDQRVAKRFLWHFIKSSVFTSQIDKIITGSAQPNFGPSHLQKIKIPLPPLETQKKIAAILDAADTYRQKTKALIAKYEELTQSLFLDMFGDPKSENHELGNYIQLIGGGTPSKERDDYWNGNIPWASVKDLKTDRLTKTTDFITELGVQNSATKVIPKGSLIIATRMAVGKCAINEIDLAINQDLKAVRAIKSINIKFLFYLLKSKENHFDSVSSGATVKGIKIEHITKLKVNIPDINLQNQFADRVLKIEAQKAQAQESLAKAEELFNSLLQRAFKGELV